MSSQSFPRCVLIDANFLVASVSPKTTADDKARIEHFFACAEKAKAKIVIPMPAVAEYLVRADIAAIETFNKLERRTFIVVAPFDRAAAFECAQLDRAALGGANDKKDGTTAPWQKIKIDRQIVATGKAHGVSLVISGDVSVRNNALRLGMFTKEIHELELPDSARQTNLELVTQKER
jgi:predicted nucleic acid-binding protein